MRSCRVRREPWSSLIQLSGTNFHGKERLLGSSPIKLYREEELPLGYLMDPHDVLYALRGRISHCCYGKS